MQLVDLTESTSIDQIRDFNQRFVPETRMSDNRFLKWKYRTPAEGQKITRHIGIVDAKRIIAQISTQPVTAWLNGEWQECKYWADWFSDPESSGSGLILLKHIMDSAESLLASSASPLAYNIYKRLKFSLMPIDQRFVFVPRPWRIALAAPRAPRRSASLLKYWSKRPLARAPKPAHQRALQVSKPEEIDPRLLCGWEVDAPKNTIFVRREPRIFSWFLKKFPYPEFNLLVLKSRDQQIGYVLTHLRRGSSNLNEGKIVDLFAKNWSKAHLLMLFQIGTQALVEQGAHIINYHASHPLFISLATESNFTKTRYQSVIMYGPIAEAMQSDQLDLHLTFYDHDESYY